MSTSSPSSVLNIAAHSSSKTASSKAASSKTASSETAPSNRFSLQSLLREPLLHFIILGGLLFAIDHTIARRQDDPHTIVVGAEIDSEAVALFEKERGHKPSADELKALHRIWLDNEVLYREGLALQVDKGDPTIRDRIIFKTLSVIDAGLKLPPIDDKGLREWFEQHRDKYDDPARYNFQEAVLSGEKNEAETRAFVAALNSGTSADAQAGLRVFKDRPVANLEQSYGVEFRKAIDESAIGTWRAIKAKDGWHAVRLDSFVPPKPADFEILRGIVLQDWKDATAAELRTASVRELGKKYNVIFESRAQ